MSSSLGEMHKVSGFVTKKILSEDAECSLQRETSLATRGEEKRLSCIRRLRWVPQLSVASAY